MGTHSVSLGRLAALGALFWLAACTVSPDSGSLDFDPREVRNRQAHAVNKAADSRTFGPLARSYGERVPAPIRRGLSNLKQTWEAPADMVHYAVQGDPENAVKSLFRFGLNTAFGFGGLLDWGGDFGLAHRATGFDETFHRYGVPEGAYVELPVLGPGTERDWTGWVLDQLLDPVALAANGAQNAALAALAAVDLLNERHLLDAPINEILYNSADSYTAQRLSYLQNRRAGLRAADDALELEDIYEDF